MVFLLRVGVRHATPPQVNELHPQLKALLEHEAPSMEAFSARYAATLAVGAPGT